MVIWFDAIEVGVTGGLVNEVLNVTEKVYASPTVKPVTINVTFPSDTTGGPERVVVL
jgi:hypothetical protein